MARLRSVAGHLFMAASACAMSAAAAAADPVDWVNPYIGTGGTVIGPDYGGTMPVVLLCL